MEDHASSAVVAADPTGTIKYWSDGASELFGHPMPVGESLDVIVPDQFRDRHWAGFHRAMSSGESPISGARVNIPVRCADGQVRVFPGTFSVLWDGHGRPVGAVAVWSPGSGAEEPFTPVEPLRAE